MYTKLLLPFIYIATLCTVTAQVSNSNKKSIRFGLNYGEASQSVFPLNSSDYIYKTTFYKIQYIRAYSKDRTINLELNIEPSLYKAEHQLLNKYYIQPEFGDDYLEQREHFTQKRNFKEYALNVGLNFRYKLVNRLDSYILLSAGPMYSEADTERLTGGIAFSDIVGLGFYLDLNFMQLDLRFTLRHNSNAGIFNPNAGHNSMGIETGITFVPR